MCTPMLALTALSTVASVVGQQQQASATNSYNQKQAANVAQAQRDNWEQINLRRQQESQAASQKLQANDIAMREAQATQVASAGPTGISLDSLLGSMGQKGATYNESVRSNFQNINQGLDAQVTNVNRGAASQVNSLKAPPPVDYLGAALKIGSSAYGYYHPAPTATS